MNRQALRKTLRSRRRSLGAQAQLHAAQHYAYRLARHVLFRKAQSIAVYLSTDGELSNEILIKLARQQNKAIYVPCITLRGTLTFRLYQQGAKLSSNRFGILEPRLNNTDVTARYLDLLILPLVGFDKAGNRLGMGGGFYDKTLAKIKVNRKPWLIGAAHTCQCCMSLKKAPWDIPLDFIATDRFLIRASK